MKFADIKSTTWWWFEVNNEVYDDNIWWQFFVDDYEEEDDDGGYDDYLPMDWAIYFLQYPVSGLQANISNNHRPWEGS